MGNEESNNALEIFYCAQSDRGMRRPDNQDFFGKFPENSLDLKFPGGQLFILADGMGGHAHGRQASELAVNTVQKVYYSSTDIDAPQRLKEALATANAEIYRQAQNTTDQKKMGTTCTILAINQSTACIAHVGDSKIFRIRGNRIEQLTQDHTHVSELLEKGIISREEARHHPQRSVLYRALGVMPEVEAQIIPDIPLQDGEYFLMCSDGLANISKEEILQIVVQHTWKNACTELIRLANERGGEDNITVQLIHARKKSGSKSKPVTSRPKRNRRKWLAILGVAFPVVAVAAYLILFEGNTTSPVETPARQVTPQKTPQQPPAENNDLNTLLQKANSLYNRGDLDGASALYQQILAGSPLHMGAIDGLNNVTDAYISKGDKDADRGNSRGALEYYQKAARLRPKDQNLQQKIVELKQKLQQQSSSSANSDGAGSTSLLNQPSDGTRSGIQMVSLEDSQHHTAWKFNSLVSNRDYLLDNAGITFLQSNTHKTVFSRVDARDADITVNATFLSGNVDGYYGIIVGDARSDKKSFLFVIDKAGSYLLKQKAKGSEEVLISGKQKMGMDEDSESTLLNLKCVGPWIILYTNGRILKGWMAKDFIRGKVGLLADSGLKVRFADFSVTPAVGNPQPEQSRKQ